MKISITRTPLVDIQPLRILFLQESNFQFVCDKCHYYGWSDDYLIAIDGAQAGYGCVWGTDRREGRDTIFEFFLLPPFRHLAVTLFAELLRVTTADKIECQSNDRLLSAMLFEFSRYVIPEAILFEEGHTTTLAIPGAIFREPNSQDDMGKDDSTHIIEWNGEIVASGGLMLNYNPPYADIYMQVKEAFRGKGFGSLIVQELKKEAYRIGKVPAARCDVNNRVSKATLLKAGLSVCGYRLKGHTTELPAVV